MNRRESIRNLSCSSLPALLPACVALDTRDPWPGDPPDSFNDRQFGARGYGTNIDSPAINRAIQNQDGLLRCRQAARYNSNRPSEQKGFAT